MGLYNAIFGGLLVEGSKVLMPILATGILLAIVFAFGRALRGR